MDRSVGGEEKLILRWTIDETDRRGEENVAVTGPKADEAAETTELRSSNTSVRAEAFWMIVRDAGVLEIERLLENSSVETIECLTLP